MQYLKYTLYMTLFAVSIGCGATKDASTDLTSELESQIKAHDSEVEAAERAQSSTAGKGK